MKTENTFIYVIGYDEEGPVKIGISTKPERRLKQLQTGQDKVLRLHHTESTSSGFPKFLEQFVHSQVNHRRLKGEWFDLSVADAIAEVKFAIMTWEDDPLLKMRVREKRR